MVRSLRFPLLVAYATGCSGAAAAEQVCGLSPAQRSFALGLFPITHRLAEVHQGAAHHDCRRENNMCGGSGTAHPRGATASHLKPTQPCRLGPTSRTQVAARCACCGWGFIWCLGLCLVESRSSCTAQGYAAAGARPLPATPPPAPCPNARLLPATHSPWRCTGWCGQQWHPCRRGGRKRTPPGRGQHSTASPCWWRAAPRRPLREKRVGRAGCLSEHDCQSVSEGGNPVS